MPKDPLTKEVVNLLKNINGLFKKKQNPKTATPNVTANNSDSPSPQARQLHLKHGSRRIIRIARRG